MISRNPFISEVLSRGWKTVLVYGVLLVLFIYPMVRLLIAAVTRDGAFSLANVVDVFANESNLRALRNSVMVGAIVTAIAVPLAALLSWVVVRTDVWGRRFLRTLLITPFFIPPFIMAFAWTRLLGRAGYLNQALQSVFDLTGPPIDVYGAGGVILVSVIYTYPYAVIVLSRSMENIGAHLEEAALISGAKKWALLRDIVFPILLPAVGSAAVIVFVTTISMFGIPAILGTPGRFIVVTTRIYGYVGGFRDPNGIGIATSLSLVLLLVAGASLLVQSLITRSDRYSTITGKSAPMEKTRLGVWRIPVTVAVMLFGCIVVLAPLLAIGATSLVKALGVPLAFGNITLEHYLRLTSMGLVQRSLQNSFFLALVVPTITVGGAVLLVHLVRRRRMYGYQLVDHIVSMPYAVPGIVIGVAMILTWIRPVFGIQIYNTIWLLLVAYIVRFMIFPMRTVSAAWKQIDPSLEEAARISGARAGRVMRDVSVPLLRSGIGSGWLLVFMPALTELTLSILLYSPGNETIGVTAFNVMQEGLVPVAAAYAMTIAGIVIGLHIITELFTHGQRNRT